MRIIRGSEVLASGVLTPYELRTDFQRILPNIFAPKRAKLTLRDRTVAAVLWSRHQGVVTGSVAAALHGAKWVDEETEIELNHANNRAPTGIKTRKETLFEDEITQVQGLAVTTVERTAFDLARRGPIVAAVQGLDSLARATNFKVEDVAALAARHPVAAGCARVPAILDLVDGGAQSPQETWWRMRIVAAGYPRPQTQVPVPRPDGYRWYFLDMGWPELMIACEYDGEQHRTDRAQYVGDVRRSEYIAVKWRRVRILGGDRTTAVFRRLEAAGLRATCEPPAILCQPKGVWE